MDDYLLEQAQKAINTIFSDTTVPQTTTRERLESLRDEIDILLESLDES